MAMTFEENSKGFWTKIWLAPKVVEFRFGIQRAFLDSCERLHKIARFLLWMPLNQRQRQCRFLL